MRQPGRTSEAMRPRVTSVRTNVRDGEGMAIGSLGWFKPTYSIIRGSRRSSYSVSAAVGAARETAALAAAAAVDGEDARDADGRHLEQDRAA